MTPVTFDGCFGWLHPGRGDRGVVLCSAFGHEAVGTHRGWLALAERLGAQGLHVLRFDYHGTGDAAGDETDPQRLDAWRDSVTGAVAMLRRTCGVGSVTLVGLRLGATLAMLAGETLPEVEAIACLAPVVSGRSYVRELRLLARTWEEANFPGTAAAAQTDALDVVGTLLDADTLAALAGIDLRRRPSPPRRVLLMDAGRPETASLGAHLAALGAAVTTAPFPGHREFLREPVLSEIPEAAFERLCAWIGPGGGDAQHRPAYPAQPTLRLAQAEERPVRFGTGDALFGILCRADRPRARAPVILMINTGRSHHVGDARLFVTLSRRLAEAGISSLRMDVGGMGDSLPAPGGTPTPLYDTRSCDDVCAALDWLERHGDGAVSVLGLCSGAYLGLHAARRDQRVVGLDLVNLQTFEWRGGALGVENRRLRRPARFYVAALLRSHVWQRVLRGRVDVATLLLVLLRRPLEHCRRWLSLGLDVATGRETAAGKVRRWFQELSARSVRVRLWYSDMDPGLSELAAKFGRGAQALGRIGGIEVRLIPEADHALHRREAREHFIRSFTAAAIGCCDGDAEMLDAGDGSQPRTDRRHRVACR